MQYKIYEELFSKVEKKLNRIGKKCKKHGNPFIFEVIGSEIKEVINEDTNSKSYYKFIIVEVEGTARIDDYECVAIIEMHNDGNIIRRINTDIDIPDRFLYTENICEHCDNKRRRKELYIIHNVVTNEFKQVGSSCLNLYTHGLNAEYVTSYIDEITELEEYNGFIGDGGNYYIPVEEVLGYATEIIDKMGYFNSSSDLTTKRLVLDMLNTRNGIYKNISNINKALIDYKFFNIEFSKSDFLKEDTFDKVKSITEYYLSLKANNEFIHNVQVLLKEGYVTWNNIGFLVYLPEGYNKYIQKEVKKAERKLINEKLEYFGEIGKRYKGQKVYEVRILTGWETQYGYTYLYKIVLESGNVLIWKSTSWYSEDELNNVDSIDFTVKNHSEYKDMKQTDVTRCKLIMKEIKNKSEYSDNSEYSYNSEYSDNIEDALNIFYNNDL